MGKWEVLLERVAYREPRVLLKRAIATRREGCNSKIHKELSIISSLPMNGVCPQCGAACAIYS